MDVKLPLGFRFQPTPEELIGGYLNHWIAGRPIEELCNIVRRADVYGSHPAKLTEEHKEFGHDGKWYFLSIAKWKGGRGAAGAAGRINRCVEGGGTWHNSQRRRVVDGAGDRQAFEYRAPGNKKTDWLMEEMASNLPEATADEGIMVICKVYLSPRAKAAREPEPDEEERQETNVAVRSKRPREAHHESLPEATSYDAPQLEPPQPEAGCSSADAGGETSQATASMDYCLTTHTQDDSSNAVYYSDIAINPEAYDDGFGDFAINAEGELVYDGYGDGGIGTQAEMVAPLAMRNSNGEITCFAPNALYGLGVGSNEEVRQESHEEDDDEFFESLFLDDGADDLKIPMG
ncbi:hypothetical protein E2562_034231 [Oryza meyeriana var. granulata]|uniref:NAC domain-containing protein n=1 Tax=Oryza meyeriana var. granulata TaxID=110450 RepID=A0A6G1CC23_9ORYZ|nr:hypothetical protein E2562_034231 [Oryza meyeriana var. granulata]